ncbi:MAG TPA: TlpA disulfide reductase family protein [Conexibacter sp.]|jgi:cytochrome c biogenesis protein CcmG/thiol:disulfide interchange protein DsbE
MRRFAVPSIVGVIAIALVALLIFGVLQTRNNDSIDQAVARGEKPAAKIVTLEDLNGDGSGSLADFRGRPVFVNFFASWCVPCTQEAPLLDEVQRMMEANGGTVVGVAVDDARDDTARFVAEHDITYPVWRDVERTFARGFGLQGIPESFVLDPQGRILALERQQITKRWIDDRLKPLLSEQ